MILAELRRPEGSSGDPYSYRKENAIHKLILTWLSWLAVLLVGAYPRRRRRRHRRRSCPTWRPVCHTPKNRLKETYSRGLRCTSYFFDVGHPRYDKLTPVKTRYPLISIMWPYGGIKFSAHRGHLFLWGWPLTEGWFFSDWIVSSCQVNLLKTGQVCSDFKVNRIITFSFIQMHFAVLFYVYGNS